jgi:hypothetical protein
MDMNQEIEKYCSLLSRCNLGVIIRNNPDKPWDWSLLSSNPNITWEIVRNNPDKDWSWYGLSKNPNITWEIVRDNPDKDWSWGWLSTNSNITWEIVRDNPDKPWDYNVFSQNKFYFDEIVNRKARIIDINFRKNQSLKILEKTSYFSRNIDRIFLKRFNYN